MRLYEFLGHVLQTHAKVLKDLKRRHPEILRRAHFFELDLESDLKEALHNLLSQQSSPSQLSLGENEDPYAALEASVHACELIPELEEELWNYPFYRYCVENFSLTDGIETCDVACELAYHSAERELKELHLPYEAHEVLLSYWKFFRRKMLGRKALRLSVLT